MQQRVPYFPTRSGHSKLRPTSVLGLFSLTPTLMMITYSSSIERGNASLLVYSFMDPAGMHFPGEERTSHGLVSPGRTCSCHRLVAAKPLGTISTNLLSPPVLEKEKKTGRWQVYVRFSHRTLTVEIGKNHPTRIHLKNFNLSSMTRKDMAEPFLLTRNVRQTQEKDAAPKALWRLTDCTPT